MTKDQLRVVLDECLGPELPGLRPPTPQEWLLLEQRFSGRFPSEMRDFIDLMAEYAFPGDKLNVGLGPNNGNATIDFTYDFEIRATRSWLPEMVPFYSIGNGDYFCVSSARCPDSPVFYYYADRRQFEESSRSFEE